MSSTPTIVIPHGENRSTCGYCSPLGQRSATASSYKTSLTALQMSCQVYQDMIDRGWRRSGTYCYKPNMKRTCCPQYTIKLDALEFKPSKSQRKLIGRWNRFILSGDKSHENMDVDDNPGPLNRTSSKSSGKNVPPFSLVDSMHASQYDFLKEDERRSARKFEITIEPASFSEEKYALYENYQENIHNDIHNTPSGFKRFLVDSPLKMEPIPYPSPPPQHLPARYGSYHQLYRVDDELIAMGVIDILPGCVSSVYFMYDKRWERFSLGKLSAMREAALAKEMCEAGAPGMTALYMGYYIHSCQKMCYKGDYSPSYLSDPETYEWYSLKECVPLLDKNRYACFSNPGHSIEGSSGPSGDPLVPLSDMELSEMKMLAIVRGQPRLIPLSISDAMRNQGIRTLVCQVAEALGPALSKTAIWYPEDYFVDEDDDEA